MSLLLFFLCGFSIPGSWLKFSVNAKCHITSGVRYKKYMLYQWSLLTVFLYAVWVLRYKIGFDKKKKDFLIFFSVAGWNTSLLLLCVHMKLQVMKVPFWMYFMLIFNFKHKGNRNQNCKILLVISLHTKLCNFSCESFWPVSTECFMVNVYWIYYNVLRFKSRYLRITRNSICTKIQCSLEVL